MRKIRFDGGTLCLDYVNTVHNRLTYPLDDYLHDARSLVEWSFQRKAITYNKGQTLKGVVEKEPEKARFFFEQAIRLRELLYHLFYNVNLKVAIPPSKINLINKLFSEYFSQLAIKQEGIQLKEIWGFAPDSLNILLAPIIKDAYELLLTEKKEKIKECPNCGWLFFDSSKNGKRRWCSMKTCGSQVKALDWYHRNKHR